MTNPLAPDAIEAPCPPLVSVDWLAAHLGDAHVRVLDASWHLPANGLSNGPANTPTNDQNSQRVGRTEYQDSHIPGAGFFDLDAACDPDSPLPHTMPSAAHFAATMRQLGAGKDDMIVFYDTGGVHAAARARWMVKSFGHQRVAVLNGGLTAWQAAGHTLENKTVLCPVGDFEASLHADTMAGAMADTNDVSAALDSGSAQIVDARGPGRFSGSEPEPREGVRPGHMPGAVNVYFADLYGSDDRLRGPAELASLFTGSDISTDKNIITTCGSGVTACCLALALEVLGKTDVKIYDGSWSEWGGRHDLPLTTGAATGATTGAATGTGEPPR